MNDLPGSNGKWYTAVRDFSGITAGCIVAGLGLALFLIPYKASPGGVGGIAQIFYFLYDVPPGIAMLIFNIPLFIIGSIIFGNMFGLKSVWGIICLSLFTDFFSWSGFLSLEFLQGFIFSINGKAISLTSEMLLAVISGAALLGSGIGVVVKFNGSTGGSDIPALLIRRYSGFSLGASFFLVDCVIISLVAIVFKNPNLLFWGLLSLFITSQATDFILEGISYGKGVFIFSDYPDDLKDGILNDLGRGCTVFDGEGGYTGKKKKILFVAVHRRELVTLKRIIKKHDSSAFIVVNNSTETFGESFKELDKPL